MGGGESKALNASCSVAVEMLFAKGGGEGAWGIQTEVWGPGQLGGTQRNIWDKE